MISLSSAHSYKYSEDVIGYPQNMYKSEILKPESYPVTV